MLDYLASSSRDFLGRSSALLQFEALCFVQKPEAHSLLNGDGGGVDKEGSVGKGKGLKQRREGNWLVCK